jgi:hypothetical protein
MTIQLREYLVFLLKNRQFGVVCTWTIVTYTLILILFVLGYSLTLLVSPGVVELAPDVALLMSAAIVVIQCACTTRMLTDHFSGHHGTHLAYYRVTRRDIRVLSCLLMTLPNAVLSSVVFTVLRVSSLSRFDLLSSFAAFFLCQTIPLFFLFRRQQRQPSLNPFGKLARRAGEHVL